MIRIIAIIVSLLALPCGAQFSMPVAVYGGTSFLPTDIATIVYWLSPPISGSNLDVSSGVADNWYDTISGGTQKVVGTGTQRPTYSTSVQNGLNALTFDGTNDRMSQSNGLLRNVTGWTSFIVLKPTNNTALRVGYHISDSGTQSRAAVGVGITSGKWFSGGRRRSTDAFEYTESTATAGASFALVSTVANYSTTTITQYINGTQDGQNTSWLTSGNTDNNAGSPWIGVNEPLQYFWQGDIGEFILYSSALSSTDRQLVENYLKAKWGL